MNWCLEYIQISEIRMTLLSERCILASLNKTTRTIDTALVAQLPGEPVEYISLDSVLDESQAVQIPVEFLNSLEVSGFSLHLLSLKLAAPIIILRSLDSPKLQYCLKAASKMLAILLRLMSAYRDYRTHIKHAYFSIFSAPGNKNLHRQRK